MRLKFSQISINSYWIGKEQGIQKGTVENFPAVIVPISRIDQFLMLTWHTKKRRWMR